MKKISETVVFFGSGPVAAQSLELLAQNFAIEAVITKPQPAHHQETFPVLRLAQKLQLPTHTPTNKQSLSDLFQTKPVHSRLGVVIDYGIIISQDVIDYFTLGIINSHFSLLPLWRGADPITFTILAGENVTGISLMLINAELDEGPLLKQVELPVNSSMTTPKLTKQLIELSNRALDEVLPRYLNGDMKPYPQPQNIKPTYSRKLTKEDGLIDWHKPAVQLEREIRAFIEWPKSQTRLGSKEVIITAAHVIDTVPGSPGTMHIGNKELIVSCGEQALAIDHLKPAGKNEMDTTAFLAGYRQYL